MLVNDIEYIKKHLLSSLPRLLNFSSVIDKMNNNYRTADFGRGHKTLERLIQYAENQMTEVVQLIFQNIVESFRTSLRIKISNYYKEEKRGKSNVRRFGYLNSFGSFSSF